MFSKTQLDRYARHIILPGVGAAGQQRLLNAKVLVVGAGGLGSPVLLYLAAAGVGTLGVVDFDTVDVSNLQRQILHDTKSVGSLKTESARQRVTSLNPDVKLVQHPLELDSSNARGTVRDYDLIIDGSDNFATRYLVNDACVLESRPLLHGAISQFEGQLSLFNVDTSTGKAPCYRCLFPVPPPPNSVRSCAEAGVFGVLPGVVGSMMASEALKQLLHLGKNLAGTLLHYDALYSETRRISLKRKPDCAVCGDAPSITELIDYEAFCGRVTD